MSWKDFFGKGNETPKFPWRELTSSDELNAIIEASKEKPQLIFKHSTRCSISSMAKRRLEREWNLAGKIEPWYLDLIAFRPISNEISENLGVVHASPQAILLKDGKAVHDSSHSAISATEIEKMLS